MPPRSLTNTTLWPVLGFQVGEVLAPLAKVTRLGRLPLASVTKSSGLPSMEDENMICEPSGDHAGALLEPRKRAKETTLLASVEYMQICGLTTPVAPGTKQVKAMREASGDQRGVREMVCKEVSGCWLAPSYSITQISFVPVRELTNAICVEAMPPPERRLMISSANWCANLRTCASVGVPR